MGRSSAGNMPCHLCDRRVTLSGLGRASHMRSHVRKGEAIEWEIPGEYGIHFDRPGTSLPASAVVVSR